MFSLASAQDTTRVFVVQSHIHPSLWLGDSLAAAVQQIWKTSAPEHLGSDSDCVPVLHFLGMNLERVDNVRSQELSLSEGNNSGEPGKLCYPNKVQLATAHT